MRAIVLGRVTRNLNEDLTGVKMITETEAGYYKLDLGDGDEKYYNKLYFVVILGEGDFGIRCAEEGVGEI